ncbi:hypothetical protein SAMN05216207_10021, partial [Pseudonocardia ammonioxydans]
SLHTLSHEEIVAVMLARATAPDPDTGDPSGTGTDSAISTDTSDSASGTGTDCGPSSPSGSDTGSNAGTGIAAQHGGSREQGADDSDSDSDSDSDEAGHDDSGRPSRAGTEADGDTDNPDEDDEDDDGTSPGASGSDAGGDTNGADGPDADAGSDSDSEAADEGADDGDSDDGSDLPEPEPDPDPDLGEGDSGGPHDDGPDGGGPSGGGGGPRGGGPNDDGGGPRGDRSGGGGGRPVPERARPGIEIRLRLSTLLGHDDHPGEIPGLGPIPAHTARDCLARQQYAEWRFAITDADGYLILAGTTRRRPPRQPGPGGRPLIRQAHGGTVELQVPATLLEQLAVDPPPGWEPLIADLAAQYADRATLLAELDRRSGERFPHPALRRHVEVRDRTCVFPGCRRPARKAQQDHTDDHQYGGPTTSDNLGPLCVFHHAIKTAGRWRVRQPVPGVFRWRSPLGWFYTTRGEPVCPPLPDPLPNPEAEVGQVEAVPGLGSPLQAEFDERPPFPTPPEEPEPEEPAEEPEPTETTDRASPDEPPF